MVLLAAVFFLCIGLVNLDFSRSWWPGQRLRLIAGLPLILIFVYDQMPALVFPQALVLLLYTFIPNAVFSLWEGIRSAVLSRRIVSIRKTPLRPYAVIVALLLAFAFALEIAPVVDAGGLRDLVDVSTTSEKAPTAPLDHLRIVPAESALFAGDKVVGQLGAYYEVGSFNIQVENGHLVWVAPLEFRDFIKWYLRRTSPGVIVVSAENPNVPAEVRQRQPMRYIPSALLNDNLYRHVYMQYGFEQILEQTLQMDDRGDPQYLVTLGRPTIGWSGQRVTAVVICNPVTGAMQRVPEADFAKLPPWVARVVPPELALQYNTWFGRYIHGWWNAHLGERDVHLPARDEVFGLIAGRKFVWFVDHTSPSASDQSMTGFSYMDTVSGKMTYYTSSGGEFSSQGAQRAIGSNPVVRQGRLLPTQPILSNVFGQNTWIVPLVADTGKYQDLALLQASTGHVTIGNVSSPAPEADALMQYRAYFASGSPGGSASRNIQGVLDRITIAGGSVYFTLHGENRIYRVEDPAGPAALLARPGDRIRFTAIPDAQGNWTARTFKNLNLK